MKMQPNLTAGASDPLPRLVPSSSCCGLTVEQQQFLTHLREPAHAPPPEMPEIGYLTHENHCETLALYGARVGGYYEYYYSPVAGNASRIKLCVPRQTAQLWSGDEVRIRPGGPMWRVVLHGPRVTL